MGNETRITPGEIQRMRAGTGVTHSEFNASATEPVHFLQIWIVPDEDGLEPGYEQRRVDLDERQGHLTSIAAPDGHDGAVAIHQDVEVLASRLGAGGQVTYKLRPGRYAWLQMISGDVDLNSVRLSAGDGAAVSDEEELRLRADSPSHLLLFDLN